MKRVKDFLDDLTVGQEAHLHNMTVYPIFAGSGPGFGYLSLDEALDNRLIEITEVSEGGDVPNLKVVNHGPTPILIIAGEELVGAKQNRVVNATFLVKGSISLTIPVSCVEHGRWSYRTRGFASEKRMSHYGLRHKMEEDVHLSVAEGGDFRADQSRVWDEIAAKSARMKVQSETGAMGDMYESYEDQLRGYTSQFTLAENQGGLLVAINGRIAGLEIFDSGDSLTKYFGKLIQSYALDAIDAKLQGETGRLDQSQIKGWVAELQESPVSLNPSVGLGKDFRISGEKLIGSGLLHEETVLYLSVFPKANGRESTKPRSSVARASRRRMFDA